jgi:hypothetical protein
VSGQGRGGGCGLPGCWLPSLPHIPSRWCSEGHTASPTSPDAPTVSYLAILAKVAAPAFLWGLGTAVGELPPYFIALAARKVSKSGGGGGVRCAV